jgi:hypothetical protein
VDGLRLRLGMPTLTVMTPDVGGASLCCPYLSIADTGLLSNARLARAGWDAMPSYLAAVEPDVIETHSVWSEASGIYRIEHFRSDYEPVVVRGIWLYLRTDHLAALRDQCAPVPLATTSGARYRGAEIDEDYIRGLGLTHVCGLR